MAGPQGLCGSRRRAPEGAGGDEGRRVGAVTVFFLPLPRLRGRVGRGCGLNARASGCALPPPARFTRHLPRKRGRYFYFNGCPMVTLSLPTPSTSHSILSPATVAATPDGVPVMMMSPGASSTISDNFEMISGTFQII